MVSPFGGGVRARSPDVFHPLPEVAGLEHGGLASWDVVKGDLHLLESTGGFADSLLSCVENDSLDAVSSDATTPDAGDGLYYVVRPHGCGQDGSWNDGTEVSSRDPGIDGSPAVCP